MRSLSQITCNYMRIILLAAYSKRTCFETNVYRKLVKENGRRSPKNNIELINVHSKLVSKRLNGEAGGLTTDVQSE